MGICPEPLAGLYPVRLEQGGTWRSYVAEDRHANRRRGPNGPVWLRGEPNDADESSLLRWFDHPDKLLVVVAGGDTAAVSAVIPPWMGGSASDPVTRAIGPQAALA